MSYLRHSLLVADESNQSISYAANFDSCFLCFVFAQWSILSRKVLFLMFKFVEDTDDDFDIAVINDGDDVDSRTSLFLMFEDVDDTDDDFYTADIDDGDDVDKNSIDEQEEVVEGVEHHGRRESTTNKPTRGDTIFFFEVFNDNLPIEGFLNGALCMFAMIAIVLSNMESGTIRAV